MSNQEIKLDFAFDVGHSSLGWAVLNSKDQPEVLACGAVLFPADDCLASHRRAFRRMRRHIRSTRQRIRRLRDLLASLEVLTEGELDTRMPSSAPFWLAARVIAGGPLLTWPELWDVLRWYAHNRGYDGNAKWSKDGGEEDDGMDADDTEKLKNAQELRKKYRSETMAETFCAVLKIDPLGAKTASMERFKGLNAAFPRTIVENEVREILTKHGDALPKLDARFIDALMKDAKALPCDAIRLPRRYEGGLLFGQLVPRFDNRIIAVCPIHSEKCYLENLAAGMPPDEAKNAAERDAKVPAKECLEFYRFRWASQLANVRVIQPQALSRFLTWAERQKVQKVMERHGALTPTAFRNAVREATGGLPDNVKDMLMHPDAKEGLILDPVRHLVSAEPLASAWAPLPIPVKLRSAGKWRKGKTLTIAQLLAECDPASAAKVQAAVKDYVDAKNTRKKKNEALETTEAVLAKPYRAKRLTGRAPFHRTVLSAVWEHVFDQTKDTIHPREPGGPLFMDASKSAVLPRKVEEQTNNHLVRHRLLMLRRLHAEMLRDFAGNDPARLNRVTIEVNRDLRTMSGMTAKEKSQELGLKLSNFKFVIAKLEKAYKDKTWNGQAIRITPNVIRKARIAEDLGWQCPYTGALYDELDLLDRERWDKDHIIPQADRPSNALDSLVLTTKGVNKMKGKRTAREFIAAEQGNPVPDMPHRTIRSLAEYDAWVEKLDTRKGHDDDKARKKFRKRLFAMDAWVEKEFVPRDLTTTSQLVRLGAQALRETYQDLPLAQQPKFTSLPGSVTGAVRRSWNLLGTLAVANPAVLNPDDLDDNGHPRVRTKTEIRDITHLHHALDACVLGLASHYLPDNDGAVWKLLVKRTLKPDEQAVLQPKLRSLFQAGTNGKWSLRDLPEALKENITQRLAERRVVQHVPKDMNGLGAEETVWRVLDADDPHPRARKLRSWFKAIGKSLPAADSGRVLIVCRKRREGPATKPGQLLRETKTWWWQYDEVPASKLIGPSPAQGTPGKLRHLKAAKIIGDNYGVALTPHAPQVLRFHKVWHQLQALKDTDGKLPVIIRKGQLIHVPQGTFAGAWRVFSVKQADFGIGLDIGRPDIVRLKNKTEGHKINVLLSSLIKSGLKKIPENLTGTAAT